MQSALVLALSFVGFNLICAGLDRNARRILPQAAKHPAVLSAVGWLLLGASIVPLLATDRASIAIVSWIIQLTVPAILTTLALTYRPQVLGYLARPTDGLAAWIAARLGSR